MSKLTKKERSWILYDCGNSAYSIAITTALFPVYFGMCEGVNGMDYGRIVSIASLVVAFLSPILGTYADYKDKKKRFFTFFATLGVLFTAMLGVVPQSQWLFLSIVYVITSIGSAGANIFYDAFLVDVTTEDRMDGISTKGFAYGYIASVVPFAISLGVVYVMGMSNPIGYQIGFIITAVWWGTLTIPMIRNVKQVNYIEPEPKPVLNSFKRLFKTFKHIRELKIVFTFIIAYFLYIDGVDTIIKMCVPFVEGTLGSSIDMFILLGFLLVIQIIAFPCALVYGKLAKRFTAKRMIIVGIITYIIACLFAFTMTQLWHIFILGTLIASAQGGIQALSRSYFAKIIPKKNANEFFGFYNIFGKFAAIIGPILMSEIARITNQTRPSILAILPLFIAGLIIMLRLPGNEEEIQVVDTIV